MAEVVWTPGALGEINDIASYIALDSFFRAGQQVVRILGAEELLAHYPGYGHFVAEMKSRSFREVVMPPYRIIYHWDVKHDRAGILAVLHSKKKLSPTVIRRRVAK